MPKEYNLVTTNKNPANSFIFTEKDLPGYASKLRSGLPRGREGGRSGYPQLPPRPQFQDRGKQGEQAKHDKGKRWQPYYRKAVPSKHKQLPYMCNFQRLMILLDRANVDSRTSSNRDELSSGRK